MKMLRLALQTVSSCLQLTHNSIRQTAGCASAIRLHVHAFDGVVLNYSRKPAPAIDLNFRVNHKKHMDVSSKAQIRLRMKDPSGELQHAR